MKKFKRLLALTIILLVFVIAILGIALVLEIIPTESAIEVTTKFVQIFGIVALAAGAVMTALHLVRD
jgi:hypothetical protein